VCHRWELGSPPLIEALDKGFRRCMVFRMIESTEVVYGIFNMSANFVLLLIYIVYSSAFLTALRCLLWMTESINRNVGDNERRISRR